jgi:hypothetical protein
MATGLQRPHAQQSMQVRRHADADRVNPAPGQQLVDGVEVVWYVELFGERGRPV